MKTDQKQIIRFGQTVMLNPSTNKMLALESDGFIKTKALLFEIDQKKQGAGCILFQSLFQIYPSFVTARLKKALHLNKELKIFKKEDEVKRQQKVEQIEEQVIMEYKTNIDISEKTKNTPITFYQSIQFLHLASNKFLACNHLEADVERENFKLELNEFPSEHTKFQFIPVFQHQINGDGTIFAGDEVQIALEHIYLGIKPYLHVSQIQKYQNNEQLLLARTIFHFPNQKMLQSKIVQSQKKTRIIKTQIENIQEPVANFVLVPPGLKKKVDVDMSDKSQDLSVNQQRKSIQEQIQYSLKQEANVSLESKSSWQVQIFSNWVQNENFVNFGDIIWLHHLELDSILVTQKNIQDDIIVNLQNTSMRDQTKEIISNTNGMWYIEHEDLKKGGIVEWGQAIRLRHFSLGKYLAIKTLGRHSQNDSCFYLSESIQNHCLFAFFPLASAMADSVTAKYVTKDAFFKLKAIAINGKNQWIQFNIYDKKKKKLDPQSSNHQQEEEDSSIVMLRISDNSKDDDVLKCYVATMSEIQETSFLFSCFPIMRKSLNILRTLKAQFLKYQGQASVQNNNNDSLKKLLNDIVQLKFNKKIQQLSKVLGDLNKFCKNQLINTQIDTKYNKKVNQNRQKVLREQYFIEILLEILNIISDEQELTLLHNHTNKKLKIKQKESTYINFSIAFEKNTDQNEISKSQIEKQYYQFVHQKVKIIKAIYHLLISICKENSENERYVYKKISQFLYQTKFFKEATLFIQSILSGNEQLISKLTDDIRFIQQNQKGKILQEISIIRLDSLSFADDMISSLRHMNKKQISSFAQSIKNNIVLYYQQLVETSENQWNPTLQNFFRQISRFQNKGISVNQEIIYKFMMENARFNHQLFMKIKLMEEILFVEINSQYVRLPNLDENQRKYFINQLHFYSDLALGRNYLWKTYLEQKFPIEFVFRQIFELNQPISMRSGFCNLAQTVYIDREPYNPLIVPNLCRVIPGNEMRFKSIQSPRDEDTLFLVNMKNLVEESFRYLISLSKELETEMINKANLSNREQKKIDQSNENQSNDKINVLTFDILKMVSTIIKCDMLNFTGQKQILDSILTPLIFMLEYDEYNMILPYLLHLLRVGAKQEAEIQKNKFRKSYQIARSLIGGAIEGIAELKKFLASQLVKKTDNGRDNLEEEFTDQTTLLSKNPIISSLISTINLIQAQSLQQQVKNSISQTEKQTEIKHQICEILIFFQELRNDYLISNFISFFTERGKQILKENKKQLSVQQIHEKLLQDLITVIPPVLRSGIDEVQKQNTSQNNIFINTMNKIVKLFKKQKEFTNYCPIDNYGFKDIDTLMSGGESYKTSILPSLICTLNSTKDYSLIDKIIEVMRRCFSQRSELFNNLEKLEILFDEGEINTYFYLHNALQELRNLTESSEVWLDTIADDPSRDQELLNVLQIVKNLSTILMNDSEVTKDMQIIQRGQDNNTKQITVSWRKQKIYKYLSAHSPLVNFIRDSQSQMAKIIKNTSYLLQTRNSVLETLKEIYRCLIYFCKGHGTNQNILHESIDYFLNEISLDFGQIDLICSIFHGNKYLCENIQDSLLVQMLNYINLYGRQTRFLLPFKVIQTYNNTNLLENQIRVLNLFVPLHNNDQEATQEELCLYGQIVKYGGLRFDFTKTNPQDQPYSYHAKLIDVLLQTTLSEESFKLNSSKLKGVFKLGYLIDILLQQDNYLPYLNKDYSKSIMRNQDSEQGVGLSSLKPKVILMINWIYINNQMSHHELLIRQQQNFNKVFEMELQRFSNLVIEDLQIPIKYLNYFFNHLIILLTSYSQQMIYKDVNQEYKDRDDYNSLFQMCKVILDFSSHLLNNYLTETQYRNLIDFVSSVDSVFFHENSNTYSQALKIESYEQSNYQSASQMIIMVSPKDNLNKSSLSKKHSRAQSILNQEDEQLIKSDSLNGTPIKKPKIQSILNSNVFENESVRAIKKSLSSKIELIESRDWCNKISWGQFIEQCVNSSLVKEGIANELQTLALSFMNVGSLIPEQLKKDLNIQLDFKDLLIKLIKYIEQGIINKFNNQNLIYSLMILEEILNQAENLEEMQNLYDKHQATKMILNIIADYKSNPFDDDFFSQLLRLGCKLLEGGNPQVQKTIFNYFCNMSKSESIFYNFNCVITQHIDEIKLKQQQIINKEKELVEQQILSEVDNNIARTAKIEFNKDSSQEVQDQNQTRQQILIQLLRFLQLFCEGHFTALQNYIRHQFNSRNNYNLIQVIVELLYWYHFDISSNNYDNIIRCLDTLTEFVQGPCNLNQQTIIDSKFLEVASTFLRITISKKLKKQSEESSKDSMLDDEKTGKRKFAKKASWEKNRKNSKPINHFTVQSGPQMERWMLERIKYKSMVLVGSLLEQNCGSLAIKRIMRSLPIEILKENLIQIYKKYRKMYGETYLNEAFQHIDVDPEDKTKTPAYHELIIETGFNIYFLINYYSELDTQDLDQETSYELQQIKKGTEKNNAFLYIQNNLIGQIFSFIFALLGGILNILLALQRMFAKKFFQAKPRQTKKNIKLQKQEDFQILRDTIQFFATNSGRIEIVRDNTIERVHFIKPTYSHYLPNETKQKFHDTVERESVNTKVSGLVDASNTIIGICKHEEVLANFFSKNKFLGIFANYVNLWKDLAFILTILINLFILLSFYDGRSLLVESHSESSSESTQESPSTSESTPESTGTPESNTETNSESSSSSEHTFRFLTSSESSSESILTDAQSYFIRLYQPRLLKDRLTVEQTQNIFDYCGYIMIICSTFVVIFFLCKKAPLYIKETWSQNKYLLNKDLGFLLNILIKSLVVILVIIKVLFFNIDVLYYLTYGTLAFVAITVHPLFYAFHLSEVVIRYPTLQNIIKSFWEPRQVILMTFLMIILLNYVFTIIAYTWLGDLYRERCESMIFCFMETFDKGFKYPGGIGGWLKENEEQETEHYKYGRFFFDNIFNIAIPIIMIQILAGIIIDTFGALREEFKEKQEDIKEICFICGLKKELFDRRSDTGFLQHTKNEHYMWNYVFYIGYLKDKVVTEYSGIESYVANKLKNFDISCFPLNKAIALSNQVLDSQQKETKMIQIINEKMNEVNKSVNDIVETIEEISRMRKN